MSDGANAAKGLPGYKKTLTQGFYPELYNAAPPAPPTAPGLPYDVNGTYSNPLTDPATNTAPPPPDRHVVSLGRCPHCGSSSFNGTTDAVSCPDCGQVDRAITPTYTPGTPWF
jgi:hypothetical protein